MDRLAAMISFRRVIEAGGFAAAARQLALSPAAVTKHIQWLEEDLGTQLLHRTTRTVKPTVIGAEFFQRCARILDDIDEAESAARSEHAEPRGTLRVNAPVSFGVAFLGSLVARFHDEHPHVRVDLTLDDRQVNPSVEGADVVLRITNALPDSSFVARKLARMTRHICAAPSYLERRGIPQAPADLASHDCVTYSLNNAPSVWPLRKHNATVEVEVTPCLVANNSLLLRDALVCGIGVGLVPSYLIREDLAAGDLRAILTDYEPTSFDVLALYAQPRQRSARVRAFVDLLAEELPRRMASSSDETPRPQAQRKTKRR
jgi:DNA-binding transcriptional LysR family regulator